MTDLNLLTVEERLALLEAKLAPGPLAVVPPITIGSLANVPAPGAQIAAQWAQDVTSIALHKFATTTALKAWAAPVGAFAVALDTGILWRRTSTPAWTQFTPWTGSAAGVALNGVQSGVISTLQIPADPGIRIANVSAFFQITVSNQSRCTLAMTVAGVNVAEAGIPDTQALASGVPLLWNITLAADDIQLAPNTPAQVTVSCVVNPVPGTGTYITSAGPAKNRVGAIVLPKGY